MPALGSAVADLIPLGRQRQLLALLQHKARQAGRQLRPQRHPPTAFVLRVHTDMPISLACSYASEQASAATPPWKCYGLE